jgi:2-oxoisovalerate dehydrogenase E1 component
MYKTGAERKSESDRDPVTKFPKFLVDEGILDRQALQRIVHEIDEEVQDVTQQALRQDPPARESAMAHLYSERVDPTSEAFDRSPEFTGEPKTMVDLINATLRDEMRRNPEVLVFGEDVADCSREESLSEVKGKGGVFKVTAGLQIEFGPRRVFNTPLAEASIVGRAIGMATRGLKPVAEIQFFDYIWPAMMQIREELATIRWRSNGGFASPVVLRVPIGGYLNGGAIYHSQCGVYAHSRAPRGDAVERARCLRPAANRNPLGRPGAFPRTQAALSGALQPVGKSRAGFHHSIWKSQSRQDRPKPDDRHVRRGCAEVIASRVAGRAQKSRCQHRSDRPPLSLAV